MDELLIRVKVHTEQDYDGSTSVTGMTHETVTVDQILAEQQEYMMNYRGFVMIDPKKGSINKRTIDLLRKNGWVHLETTQKREEKKVLEQVYYLLDDSADQANYWHQPKFTKIDINDLTEHQLKQLANGAQIVQVAKPKSVLPPDQYRKLQTKREQLEQQRQKRKEAAEKKAQKKKQKEIEAAKRLLQEAEAS